MLKNAQTHDLENMKECFTHTKEKTIAAPEETKA